MKKILTLGLAVIMALALCACGSSGASDENQTMYGTYMLYAMDYDEETVVFADELFEGENYITLKSGGIAEMCLEDELADVKWKAEGEKLTITADDGDMEATLSDGIMALLIDGLHLYFVGENASTDSIHAVTIDEMLFGAAEDAFDEVFDEPAIDEAFDEPAIEEIEAEAPAAAGETEIQKMWNGWYYGCIDMDGCTDDWAFLNGATYDAVMYVELDRDGVGRFAIYDPFGDLISNEHSNLYVQAECHADTQYLYGDSGVAFDDDLNPSDWVIVHNLAVPEKLNVGSESWEDSGAKIGYDFQFKPWGDRWEGDNYTQFIPYFDAYIDAIDAGLASPFGDTFTGFGIAEPSIGGGESPETAPDSGAPGELSALLGANPAKLDVNDKGAVFIYYPAEQFYYDPDYGKLKNDDTGVGILIDPMLGSTNFDELKASYEENNSDEEDYSLTETTINGHKAMIMTYSDWLGSTMRVDIDFGGEHDGFYGMSFAVSGDSIWDCDTDIVWAIIESMEVVK